MNRWKSFRPPLLYGLHDATDRACARTKLPEFPSNKPREAVGSGFHPAQSSVGARCSVHVSLREPADFLWRSSGVELRGKNVMVLGLARTGRETARFLARNGALVRVSDRRPAQELRSEIDALADLPIRFLLGGEEPEWLEGVEAVITSPGVPAENPLLRDAGKRGIAVLSEVELAYRFLGVPLVAITGTNGKSTTTSLVGEMLKVHGLRSFVGGNIGNPLIGFAGGDWEWGVVEVSSFQLEWVERFRPKVSILLNVTEDHLDRYADFVAYRDAKAKIFAAQEESDCAVLNRDDPLVWSMRHRLRAEVISFGWSEVAEGLYASAREIVWRRGGRQERFSLAKAKILGVHNVDNLMAAVAAAKVVGVPAPAIQAVIEAFAGLEHRLEFVREKDGVGYYNDSKGTNVGAVLRSLMSFSGPVILLAGGVDKGGDYGILGPEIKAKVKKLILFGAAREKIRAALGHLTDTVVVDGLEGAVRAAVKIARDGDIVLLSPACSSFDMFPNYAERGKAFKALVARL